MEATVMVQNFPAYESAMKAPSNGVKLEVRPKFLDKSAIVTEEDNNETPNLWKLNTVHRVKKLKSLIRMGPIWASGILLITTYTQQNTFSLQQAKTMDRHLIKSFQIPAGSMSVFTILTMLITTAFYDRVFIRVARRFTGLDRGISFLHRMGIGLVISTLATLVAGFIEVKRKKVAMAHGLIDHSQSTIPISVFWLVPQYSLYGMVEAFMSFGHLEFFYDQAPESMRSTAMALFWTSISVGNYVSTLLVTLVHKFSARPDRSNWLPDNNLNKGKLEYFYWLITPVQFFNFIYHLCCAKMYIYKPIQVHLEFFYDQAPESMRGTTMALFWTSISVGNYVSTLLVTLVHKFSARPDGSNWLPDNNLNKGKLEYFYWLITLVQFFNFIYHLCCAKMYIYKQIQVHGNGDNSSEENQIELGIIV